MKRCAGLSGLAREHHSAVRLAREARRATAGEAGLAALVVRLKESHATLLEPHFLIEETLLLPALAAAGEAAAVTRTLADHAALRTLVDALDAGEPEAIVRYGTLLDSHIRFEDRELFVIAEAKLAAGVLEAVGRACP